MSVRGWMQAEAEALSKSLEKLNRETRLQRFPPHNITGFSPPYSPSSGLILSLSLSTCVFVPLESGKQTWEDEICEGALRVRTASCTQTASLAELIAGVAP
ncbi:unnamed protein product [Pleuronectes platessa]|uniref:Uncharacterized protein n=1 Tax=Pleuronectes platessa TaxID=8262 RepID=A0A9N7YZH1_PLEPL|nr:unnamed protein product [Pleuronectes platessa]